MRKRNKVKTIFIASVMTSVFSLTFANSQASRGLAADVVFYNGKIITVDKSFSIVEAVAIKDGKFVAVGSNEEVASSVGESKKKIDLKGKTVIPGLIDNHNHLLMAGLNERGVDLSQARSMSELLATIEKKVKQTPPGTLIFTSSAWHESQLKEKRLPTRWDLDPISSNHPVYVIRGGHEVILNSYALRLAGITKDTPAPEGGKITKDAKTGEPTGEMIDNAIDLVKHLLPPVTYQDKVNAIKKAMSKLNEAGVTSVRETGLSPEDMKIYQELWARGELTLRISMMPRLNTDLPLQQIKDFIKSWGVVSGFGDDMLKIDAVKMGIDGGFEGGLMSKPYVEPSDGFYGIQRIPTEKFNEIVVELNRQGWRVGVHCVGDRAIDLVLDAYEKANEEKSIVGKRWILEHAFLVRPDQFERIKRLGLVVSAQDHTYAAAPSMVKYWGEERTAATMPMREWIDNGIIVGGGTDWPVVPYNPFLAIYFWTTRDTRFAGVLGSEHKITREEALKLHTINNAYLTFEENIKGSIEVGKLADLAVLSDDYMSVPESKIRDLKVLMAMVGGRIVYQSRDF